jgi:hypothetical protein
MIFFYKGYPEKLGGKWGEKIPIIRLIDCAVFASPSKMGKLRRAKAVFASPSKMGKLRRAKAVFASPSKMGKLRRAKAVFALKASDVIFDYAETSRRAK